MEGIATWFEGVTSTPPGGMDTKEWRKVKRHLTDVYTLLGGASMLAAIGAYVEMTLANVGRGLLMVAMLLNMGSMMGVRGAFGAKYRKPSFAVMGFVSGFLIGPLVDYSLMVNEKIVFYALAGAFGIFSALSLSALLAKDNRYLLLGGLLSSMLSILFWVNIASLVFPSRLNYNLQIYGGLFMFCGYILFDTQRIVQSALEGATDPIKDATHLFINLVAIVRRLLIILAENEQRNRRQKNRRDSR